MKITTPDGFSITSSSNTYHFDHLDVGESISKTISMQANPNAEAQAMPSILSFPSSTSPMTPVRAGSRPRAFPFR